jgi:hypothetical protein
MKKIMNYSFVAILTIGLCFGACKKETSTPAPTPPAAAANYVCSGKSGVTGIFPLTAGDVWIYGSNYNVSGANGLDTSRIEGTAVFNGVTYVQIHYYQSLGGGTGYVYYRTATNGDVYVYSAGTEYLYMPASPVAGQTLGPDGVVATTRKIISTTASLTTPKCTYSNCVQVQLYGQTGGVIGTDYYKAGLGLLYTSDQYLAGITLH